MMKRINGLLLTVIILCSVITCFVGCNEKLDNLEYYIENGEIYIDSYTDKTTITELAIPDEINGVKVTVVEDFGVVNAESLKKITIGKNVREIGSWAFTNNRSLVEFVVDEENTHFTAVDGVLYTKDMKRLLFYPAAKGVIIDEKGTVTQYAEYTVPEGVEEIGSKAFYKCVNVKSIVFPTTLRGIEEKAFHHCEALSDISLPNNLEYIKKDGFAYCTSLTAITIPASIKEIGEYAFYNCTLLMNIQVNRQEAGISFGKKWYPTDNGRDIEELVINYNG